MTGGIAFGEHWTEINVGLPSIAVGVVALSIDRETSSIYARTSTGEYSTAQMRGKAGGQSPLLPASPCESTPLSK
jgi:hypothetical protein